MPRCVSLGKCNGLVQTLFPTVQAQNEGDTQRIQPVHETAVLEKENERSLK